MNNLRSSVGLIKLYFVCVQCEHFLRDQIKYQFLSLVRNYAIENIYESYSSENSGLHSDLNLRTSVCLDRRATNYTSMKHHNLHSISTSPDIYHCRAQPFPRG